MTGRWPDGAGMIYLGMSPWEGMWRNRHQLMSRFAASIPVLYVQPAQKLKKLRKEGRPLRRIMGSIGRPAVERLGTNLGVFRSREYHLVSGFGVLGTVTEDRWYRAVANAAHNMGIRYPILWTSIPAHAKAIGRLNEVLSVYHVVDEYSGYTLVDEVRRKRLKADESQLLDTADVVVAVSDELVQAKRGSGRDVHLVENAVDFEVFQQAAESAPIPEDMISIPGPRLGYSGLIGKRLDLDLLERMATSYPDWSIVLIGKVDDRRCESAMNALRARPNVHFLGEKHISDVPAYVAGLDVGLLPYEVNEETLHISPLKMYEYLATGLPVVSKDIPSAQKKRDHVAIASDEHGFFRSCEEALSDSVSGREARIAEAATNTWDQRVQQLEDILVPRLNESLVRR
ncbi:MAG: glycosyltransferase [Woeseiaceae bacterium]|nr:glycosyltransferase [Woeseiaceae bacterium]